MDIYFWFRCLPNNSRAAGSGDLWSWERCDNCYIQPTFDESRPTFLWDLVIGWVLLFLSVGLVVPE